MIALSVVSNRALKSAFVFFFLAGTVLVEAQSSTNTENAGTLYFEAVDVINKGELLKAKEMMERVAELAEQPGQDPYDYCSVRSHWWLGSINRRLGKPDVAESHYKKALEINEAKMKEKDLFPNRVAKMALLMNLESLYQTQGKLGLAATCFRNAKTAMESARKECAAPGKGGPSINGIPKHFVENYIEIVSSDAWYLDRGGQTKEAVDKLRELIRFINEIPADRPRYKPVHHHLAQSMNDLAVKLDFLGYTEESLKISKSILDLLEQTKLPAEDAQRYRLDCVMLKLHVESGYICDLSQWEGVTKERMARIDEIIEYYRTNNVASQIPQTTMQKGIMFLCDDKHRDALDTLNLALKTAEEHGHTNAMMDIRSWIIEVKLSAKTDDIREQEILDLLEYYRSRGLKKMEPGIYARYARWLITQKRHDEALAIFEKCYDMGESFNMHHANTRILTRIADLHRQMGNIAAYDETWRRTDRHLEKHPDLPKDRILDALLSKLDYCSFKQDGVLYASIHETAAQIVGNAGLPSKQTEHFADYPVALKPQATAGGIGSAPVTNIVEAGEVDLQPSIFTTRVSSGEYARARFTISNPSGITQTGTVTVTGKYAMKQADTTNLFVLLDVAPTTNSLSMDVSIPPDTLVALYLQAAPPEHPELLEKVAVAWEPTNRIALWAFTRHAEAEITSVVSGHVLRENPFYAVPIYHEIYYRGNDAIRQNFRITASTPCRVEVFDEVNGTPMAVDANGDGDFEDVGDVLFRDENADAFPDVLLSTDKSAAALEILVYPHAKGAPDGRIEVTISLQSLGDPTAWTARSLTVINTVH